MSELRYRDFRTLDSEPIIFDTSAKVKGSHTHTHIPRHRQFRTIMMDPLRSSNQQTTRNASKKAKEEPAVDTHQQTPTTTVTATDTLTVFPNEIFPLIFQYLDLPELSRCLAVNKLFYSVLNPSSSSSQHCWRGIRQRFLLPDPVVLDLSEYKYLRIIFKKSFRCDFCRKVNAKEYLSPIWEFHGHRICSGCWPRKTISGYHLLDTLHPRQYKFLPKRNSSRNEGDDKDNVYLRSDIINHRIPNGMLNVFSFFISDLIS